MRKPKNYLRLSRGVDALRSSNQILKADRSDGLWVGYSISLEPSDKNRAWVVEYNPKDLSEQRRLSPTFSFVEFENWTKGFKGGVTTARISNWKKRQAT